MTTSVLPLAIDVNDVTVYVFVKKHNSKTDSSLPTDRTLFVSGAPSFISLNAFVGALSISLGGENTITSFKETYLRNEGSTSSGSTVFDCSSLSCFPADYEPQNDLICGQNPGYSLTRIWFIVFDSTETLQSLLDSLQESVALQNDYVLGSGAQEKIQPVKHTGASPFPHLLLSAEPRDTPRFYFAGYRHRLGPLQDGDMAALTEFVKSEDERIAREKAEAEAAAAVPDEDGWFRPVPQRTNKLLEKAAVTADAWLARYVDDQFYAHQVRAKRRDDLRDIRQKAKASKSRVKLMDAAGYFD